MQRHGANKFRSCVKSNPHGRSSGQLVRVIRHGDDPSSVPSRLAWYFVPGEQALPVYRELLPSFLDGILAKHRFSTDSFKN